MTFVRRKASVKLALAALLATTMSATPALAQDASAGRRVVDGEKILDLLVAKGLITAEEAYLIVEQATVVTDAPAEPEVVAGGVAGNVLTVPYIPEPVLAQVREQVKAELTQAALAEGWATPGETPEWTKRISLSGDVRIRGEGIFLPDGNYPDFLDFQSINNGAPYNINPQSPDFVNPPFLNSVRDRNMARLRARIGLTAQLTQSISAEIQIATGNDNSPVSTNQTLGGGDGNFSKYSLWLDRANIRIAPRGVLAGTELVVGRATNPFWTTELLFDEDLNFDGVSLAAKKDVTEGVEVFAVAGAFPIYNTAFNFGSREVSAFKSRDRWLLAAQAGASAGLADDVTLRGSVGYFRFSGVRGALSSLCAFGQDVCDTDNTRPLFMQHGNTVYPIRLNGPNPDPTVNPSLTPNPQYFGLAADFHLIEAHGELTFAGNVPISLEGEFIKNLSFKRGKVLAVYSNVIPSGAGTYRPGGVAWGASLRVGVEEPMNWGEWKLQGGYRHIDTDAVIDAFNSSEFHLGGTNARGYFVNAGVGIGGGAGLGVRYYATDEVTGAPFAVDTLLVDLSAHF